MQATYNKYTNNIEYGSTSAAAWSAPSDWIDISSVGSNEINLLVKEGSGIAFTVTTAGTFSINWGDGSVVNGLTSGIHQHQHTTGGTPCSLGYNTWKIRIYGASSDITAFRISKHAYTLNTQQPPVLSAVLNVPGVTDYSYCFASPAYDFYCRYLLACDIRSFRDAATTSYMFSGCTAFASVTLPVSWGSNATTAYMFNNCACLRSVTLPASFGSVLTTTYMFDYCYALTAVSGLTSWGSNLNASYMFDRCSALTSVSLPTAWGSVTNVAGMFYNNSILPSLTLPSSWGMVQIANAMFINCQALDSILLPVSWGSLTNANNMFQQCASLSAIALPSSWGNLSLVSGMFQNCYKLASFTLPSSWGSLTNTSWMFASCYSLSAITLPVSLGSSLSNAASMFNSCYNLKTINNYAFAGSNLVQANLTDFVKDCDFLQIAISNGSLLSNFGLGSTTTNKSKINSVRLTNPGSLFVGNYPEIDVSYSDLSAAALNLLFGDLPALSGKTIKITGTTGAASCTRTIATAKGWAVSG